MQDTSARPVLSSAIRLIYVKVLGVIAFLLATTVAVMAEMIPLPRARPVDIPGDSSTIGAEAAVSPCRSRLAEIAAFKVSASTGPRHNDAKRQNYVSDAWGFRRVRTSDDTGTLYALDLRGLALMERRSVAQRSLRKPNARCVQP
jgi:hypothetical protein